MFNNKIIDSPCYKCSERHVGCHSNCEKYSVFSDELKEERTKNAIAKDRIRKSFSLQHEKNFNARLNKMKRS